MHVEHGVECQTLPGEPSTRQMEHFLHQTPPSKACAKVAPPPVLLLTCCVVLLSMYELVYYTEVCCWLCDVPPLS